MYLISKPTIKDLLLKTYCAGLCFLYLCLPKLGLSLVDLLENVFRLCMHRCNHPAGIMLA